MRLPKHLIRTREDGATHTEAAHIPGGRSLRDLVFWVDTMMTEELGLTAVATGAPLRSGLVVAVAYALGAAFPVIPYALPLPIPNAFALSIGCTLLALFAAGSAKTRMTGRPWLRSGLETVLVGALAAAATYAAGGLIAG